MRQRLTPAALARLLCLATACIALCCSCASRQKARQPETRESGFAYWSCLENDTVYSPLSLAQIRQRADTGDPAAMTALGDLAATKEMYEPAVRWFMRAANSGYAPACLLAGEYLPDAPNLVEDAQATALGYLREAAKKGVGRAPFLYLQRSLRQGSAMPEQEFAHWLPHVLESDDLDDMHTLWQLASKEGYAKLRAAFLSTVASYGKQAEAGSAKAAWVMYLLHNKGIAAPHNPARAESYLARALATGSPEAMYHNYTEHPENTAPLLAAAERGYIPALLKAGEEYGVGKGSLPRDREKAKELFGSAARQGNTRATYLLGLLWAAEAKSGVPNAARESFRWIEKAAEMGSTDAFRKLAGYYQTGTGVAEDAAKAQYWNNIAGSASNPVPKTLEQLLIP